MRWPSMIEAWLIDVAARAWWALPLAATAWLTVSAVIVMIFFDTKGD